MIITRTSILSGQTSERDIDCTEEQLDLFMAGIHVQLCFPHLSTDDREFILSGITPEEWTTYLGVDDAD